MGVHPPRADRGWKRGPAGGYRQWLRASLHSVACFAWQLAYQRSSKRGAAIRCEGVYWFPPRFTDGLANGIGYDSPEALREEAQEKQDK